MRHAITLAAMLLCPYASAAQQSSDLVGKRVRVQVPSLGINDDNATLISWSTDSITLSLRVPVLTPTTGGIGLDPATLFSSTRAKIWAPAFALAGAEVELWVDQGEPQILHVRNKHFSIDMPVSAVSRLEILEGRGQSVTLPLGSVQSIDRYAGRKSAWRSGAGLGFLVGAVGGVAAVRGMSCIMGCTEVSTGQYAGGAVFGGLIGAGLGALVGAMITWDDWERVPRYKLRAAPVVGPGQFGLVGAVRF